MPTNKPPYSKWHQIKQQSEASEGLDPIAKIKRLFLDTQIGSPADTIEEVDAQRNNQGPADTKLEAEDSEESNYSSKL